MAGTNNIHGTTLDVGVTRVVDGDTIKVDLRDEETNLRLLALDTEEANAGSNKPVTPWGEQASKRLAELVPEVTTLTIEFPGTEPVETCLRRYRGNYGRPLVYAHVDGKDVQETMIREGYSPYFTKYGYAPFRDHHRRYRSAEREAQAADIGVWNQQAVNGSVMRNYSALKTWWDLRAELVETYREQYADEVFDSRLDYRTIVEAAEQEPQAVVFTELQSSRRVGDAHAIIDIGSQHQPFKLFLPNAVESEVGQRILKLLDTRYLPADYDGATIAHPRRSYAYVSGTLERYEGEPEIVVTSTNQLRDAPETDDSGIDS